jgi:TetR/AcrR family transcriptional repressor of bet genes
MARKSSEERRAEISHALLRVMAEHGYVKASMPRIAEAADVTQGLIHYHFDNKQAILLHVLETIVDAQMQRVDAAVESAASPPEALRAVIDAFLATGDSAQPEVVAAWVAISAEAIRQEAVREAFVVALNRMRSVFATVIEAGEQVGAFDLGGRSVEACTSAILSTIQGYYTTAAIDRELVPHGSAADATMGMLDGLLGLD